MTALLAERLRAQLLTGRPARDPLAVAERLLAVQGQDARGFRLAVRARTADLCAADVDRALSDERSLLVTWLNRGTLQLVRSEDYWWLQALTTPPLVTAVMRRLAQEGVDPAGVECAVAEIVRAVGDDGPQTRAQLAGRVDAIGVPTARQALIHLLFLTAIRGEIVRGPMLAKQHAYVRAEDWLGPRPQLPDREQLLAELARRYLAGHQPANDRDLARWAGLPLRDARAGLEAIASSLRERPDGLVALRAPRRSRAVELPAPRLLGAFDPVLIGWPDRTFVTGPHNAALIRGGMFRPSAVVGGRTVAAWGLVAGRVALEPLEELDDDVRAALEADGDAVCRYLGTA